MLPSVFLVAISCHVSPETATVVRVDMIELNHYYDPDGKHIFDQVIIWEWVPREDSHRVLWWRIYRGSGIRKCGPCGAEYVEHCEGGIIKYKAIVYRETWTQRDPEMEDRDRAPGRIRPEPVRWRGHKSVLSR